ncbi:MAG: discoidin domain-containing protein [Armatimonadota bacterium]
MMRSLTRLLTSVALLATAAAGLLAQGDGPPQRWQVQATGPVTLSLHAAAADAAWARSADGAWHQLQISPGDGQITLTLSAQQLQGGAALVVIDPPEWLNLDDAEPPAVVRFTIDRLDYAAQESVDLGWTASVPYAVTLAVQDEHNPIDPASVRVSVAGTVLRPGDRGVRFVPHGQRAGTLHVSPRQIEGLADAVRARLELVVDDYAIDERDTRRSVAWAVAPSFAMDDGTVVTVDSVTAADGWAQWWVLVDGESMTEEDTTTAGKTWLSDNREDEHWLRFDFPQKRTVDGIDLWWPWYQTWRTSRSYEVQTWDGTRWVTQVQVTDQEERQHSEHRFAPVSTTRVRVLQEPMGGQAERQDLMWLAEAQVHFAP